MAKGSSDEEDMKAYSEFDYLAFMTNKKKPWDINDHRQGKYSQFMMNSWLSSDVRLLSNVNYYANDKRLKLTDEEHFKVFYYSLDTQFRRFTLPRKSVKSQEMLANEIECIQKYYNCSKKDAEFRQRYLKSEDLKTIVASFNKGKFK